MNWKNHKVHSKLFQPIPILQVNYELSRSLKMMKPFKNSTRFTTFWPIPIRDSNWQQKILSVSNSKMHSREKNSPNSWKKMEWTSWRQRRLELCYWNIRWFLIVLQMLCLLRVTFFFSLLFLKSIFFSFCDHLFWVFLLLAICFYRILDRPPSFIQ